MPSIGPNEPIKPIGDSPAAAPSNKEAFVAPNSTHLPLELEKENRDVSVPLLVDGPEHLVWQNLLGGRDEETGRD